MGDEPLDLGPIEPGRAPADRPVHEGQHPWAPSALDQFDDGEVILQLAVFMNAIDHRESNTVLYEDLDRAGQEAYLRDAERIVKAMRVLGWGPRAATADE